MGRYQLDHTYGGDGPHEGPGEALALEGWAYEQDIAQTEQDTWEVQTAQTQADDPTTAEAEEQSLRSMASAELPAPEARLCLWVKTLRCRLLQVQRDENDTIQQTTLDAEARAAVLDESMQDRRNDIAVEEEDLSSAERRRSWRNHTRPAPPRSGSHVRCTTEHARAWAKRSRVTFFLPQQGCGLGASEDKTDDTQNLRTAAGLQPQECGCPEPMRTPRRRDTMGHRGPGVEGLNEMQTRRIYTVYSGKRLQPTCTLRRAGIEHGAVLRVYARLCGGTAEAGPLNGAQGPRQEGNATQVPTGLCAAQLASTPPG